MTVQVIVEIYVESAFIDTELFLLTNNGFFVNLRVMYTCYITSKKKNSNFVEVKGLYWLCVVLQFNISIFQTWPRKTTCKCHALHYWVMNALGRLLSTQEAIESPSATCIISDVSYASFMLSNLLHTDTWIHNNSVRHGATICKVFNTANLWQSIWKFPGHYQFAFYWNSPEMFSFNLQSPRNLFIYSVPEYMYMYLII